MSERSIQPFEFGGIRAKQQFRVEPTTTALVSGMPEGSRSNIATDLENLAKAAFPAQSAEIIAEMVGGYFLVPQSGARHCLFVREAERLVAAAVFDMLPVIDDDGLEKEAVYIVDRLVDPSVQEAGIGGLFSQVILHDLQPDILMTTCAQTPSLWSWINTVTKDRVQGFAILPRIENEKIVIPSERERQRFIRLFCQAYREVAGRNPEKIARKALQIDEAMVRRGVYAQENLYFHAPWRENDRIAQALQLTDKDGILVVIEKI